MGCLCWRKQVRGSGKERGETQYQSTSEATRMTQANENYLSKFPQVCRMRMLHLSLPKLGILGICLGKLTVNTCQMHSHDSVIHHHRGHGPCNGNLAWVMLVQHVYSLSGLS